MKTRLKVLVAGVGMVAIAMAIMGIFMMTGQQEQHEREVENNAQVLLAAISVPCVRALSSNRIEELDQVLEEFAEGMVESADVESVAVLDNQLRVVGHTDKDLYGRRADDEFSVLAASQPEVLTRVEGKGRSRAMLVSKPLDTSIKGLPGIRWGTLVARIGLARADREIRRTLWVGLQSVGLFALITALLLFFVLERLFLRPIARLSEAAESIREGDLTARSGIVGRGELGSLGATFDRMAEELKKHTDHLQKLVYERTEKLNHANQDLVRTAGQLKLANEALQELARTDSLTGLSNRRHMTETLDFHFALARRGGRPISFAMLDVDFFKHYNDTNGHPAGDEVLRALSDLIRQRVRKTDIPCRYGGEEFAIMFPDTDGEQSLAVAEEVRRIVEEHAFPLEEKQPDGGLTVSIGVAVLDKGMEEVGDLIARADEALYKAKAEGRNRTILAAAHDEETGEVEDE